MVKPLVLSRIVAVAVGLLTPVAMATTVLQVDVPEMTQTSEWVIRATVASTAYVDLRADGKGLYTDVTLDVRDVYKGQDVPRRYVLRLVGGVGNDGTTMMIPGMPGFKVGDDLVVFLEKTSIGHVPCGLGQGVWRVLRGAGDELWVRQRTGGVHMVRRVPAGHLETVGPLMHTPAMQLALLMEQIYAAQEPRLPNPGQTSPTLVPSTPTRPAPSVSPTPAKGK